LSVILLRSVSCVFTIKIGLDWIEMSSNPRQKSQSKPQRHWCWWRLVVFSQVQLEYRILWLKTFVLYRPDRLRCAVYHAHSWFSLW